MQERGDRALVVLVVSIQPDAKLRYFPSPQPLAFGTLRSPGGRGALKQQFWESPPPPGEGGG